MRKRGDGRVGEKYREKEEMDVRTEGKGRNEVKKRRWRDK